MSAIRINNSSIWKLDHDPASNESPNVPVEQYDILTNTNTNDFWRCYDATPDNIKYIYLGRGDNQGITWTPIIVGNTQAGTGTYTTQTGLYQRFGTIIFASFQIEWSAHTGTGNMSIDGHPIAFNTSLSQKNAVFPQSVTLPVLSLSTMAKTNNSTNRFDVVTNVAGTVDASVAMSSSGKLAGMLIYTA